MDRAATIDISPEFIAEVVSWRRHIHKFPELAYREHRTADFVASHLEHAGLIVRRGMAGTGVVGTLKRGASTRTIGIRADMDALPIQEQSTIEHASRNPGVMHACGHDGHVVMALAAARVCAGLRDLDGTVHFIFQPAEENEGGARRMMEQGLFREFPCDAVFALHNWPTLRLGTCVARDGAMMAALATFEIAISGKGCHAAMPHEGSDAMLAGCQLVSALHTIIGRNVDPSDAGVVSATQIHAGETWNVIPSACIIRGTARWFEDRVGEIIEQRIRDLTQSIVTAFGCDAKLEYERRFPATVNDPDMARLVRRVASSPGLHLDVIDACPSMASEDFAFMLQALPGCYFWLGTGTSGGKSYLHSPSYDFNDDVVACGVALWVSLVRQSLTPDLACKLDPLD